MTAPMMPAPRATFGGGGDLTRLDLTAQGVR